MRRAARLAVVLAASIAMAPAVAAASAVSDVALYDMVNRKLNSDADIHGNITVDVKNGVVTLTGTVGTARVRTKAEHIVRRIKGVKQVIDDLTAGTP